VARILQSLARLGITIVTVIHQPRTEIFDCIDDLLLIAPGGVTAYCGPRGDAIPHFRQMGYIVYGLFFTLTLYLPEN
jgi:ABC-type multidrug transport system ATPase subunit